MNPRGAIERVADCLQELTSEIDSGWIGDALREHDRQDKRERKLPASSVMWLVLGMGLLRDRCIPEVAVHLGLTSIKGRFPVAGRRHGCRPASRRTDWPAI